ncbi:MAG: SprT-like domain-containing protein [Sphingobium sp.]
MSASPALSLSPTAQAYAELQSAFDHYNRELFAGELPHCLITMQREKRTYGYFSSERFVHRHDKSKTDEIAINPAYFAVVPLLEILQTLVHEMAHAWQFHFGKPGRRGYHNKEWADKMEAIGLMPSSTGKPGGARTGEKMADYAIPGGPFITATDALLTQDFRISWLDRFPAIAPTAPAAIGADDDGEGDDLADVLQPVAGNRSNRIKYRCPSCGAQAWGKPSLRLLCGADDCKAVALDPVE